MEATLAEHLAECRTFNFEKVIEEKREKLARETVYAGNDLVRYQAFNYLELIYAPTVSYISAEIPMELVTDQRYVAGVWIQMAEMLEKAVQSKS